MKKLSALLFCLALALCLSSCVTPKPKGPPPPLILISMDGLRWDYRDRYPDATPNLRQLAREGASAKAMIPVFPSNTFPNHYTIVTGLYPSHHGIVNNHLFDASTGEYFHYNTTKSSREPQWWGGEPIWITAVKQGHPSACSYWPGSEAEIKGVHATYWKPYNYYDVTYESRLDELIGWLKKPEAERPIVIPFYFEETNGAGHEFGPDSPELIAAVKLLDDRLGQLRARLKQEQIAANLIIVSDHGMTPAPREQILILDDYIDVTKVQIDDYGTTAHLRPQEGTPAALVQALAKMPHTKTYLAENLPARFHLEPGPRLAPVIVVPELGWRVMTRANFNKPPKKPLVADHGYDPAYEAMQATLIVGGPSFRHDGAVIAPVENIHVYNLMCAALHLTPAKNDGDDRLVKAFLRE